MIWKTWKKIGKRYFNGNVTLMAGKQWNKKVARLVYGTRNKHYREGYENRFLREDKNEYLKPLKRGIFVSKNRNVQVSFPLLKVRRNLISLEDAPDFLQCKGRCKWDTR
jgi:hypothetical protein